MLGKSKSLTTCPAWQVISENYVSACIGYVKQWYVQIMVFLVFHKQFNNFSKYGKKGTIFLERTSYGLSLLPDIL